MKYFISGASGFLGSYLVDDLAKVDHNQIIAISRTQRRDERKNVRFFQCDLATSSSDMVQLMSDAEVVIHAAGNVRSPGTDSASDHEIGNSVVTKNILQASEICKPNHLIYISTCEVYGEIWHEKIREGEDKKPANDYAISKLYAEELCSSFAEKANILTTVLRPSYIYGYGMKPTRLFYRLVSEIFGNEVRQLQVQGGGYDYIYVRDVVRGILLSLNRRRNNLFEEYNLASGYFTNNWQVFAELEKVAETGKEITPIESRQKYSLDISKAQKDFSFSPNYTLKDGLKEFVHFYLENQ